MNEQLRHPNLLMIRRLALSFGGEGLQSGFHFLLSLLLIGVMGAHDFGLFAIIFIIGGVSLSYGNALISVPASVEIARSKYSRRGRTQEVDFGTIAVLFAIIIGAIVAGGLWLTLGNAWESIAGGAFIGFWMIRNHLRTMLFVRDEASTATVSDCSYSIAGGIFVAAALLYSGSSDLTVTEVMVSLAAANAISIATIFAVARRRPRARFHRKIFSAVASIWRQSALSALTATTGALQGQAFTFLIAATAGPAAYAPIAAGALLFAPLRPAVWAVVQVYRPHFARAFSNGQAATIGRTAFTLTVAIIVCCLILSGLIWAMWAHIGEYVFHNKFDTRTMTVIVTLIGLSSFLYLTYNVPVTILQAGGEFRPIATATVLGACTCLISVGILLIFVSTEWSLAGVVLGEAVCALYLWTAAIKLMGRRNKMDFELGSAQTHRLTA